MLCCYYYYYYYYYYYLIKLKLVIHDLFLRLFSLSVCVISEGANNILCLIGRHNAPQRHL